METCLQPIVPAPSVDYVLVFEPLCRRGRAYSFPCDAQGRVVLDTLTERSRNNYLFARAVVGRDLTHPCVVRA